MTTPQTNASDRITQRIAERSRPYRTAYLERLEAARRKGAQRGALGWWGCSWWLRCQPLHKAGGIEMLHSRVPSPAAQTGRGDDLAGRSPRVRHQM